MSGIEIKEMTEEVIVELMLDQEIAARISGFKSLDDFCQFKLCAGEGMIKFGGSFTHFLGHALARADTQNSVKLIRAFRDDCEHHADLYKKFLINRERDMTENQ